MSVVRGLIALALCVAATASESRAQDVSGLVVDSTGKAIAEADVILAPAGTRTRSDARGRFIFRGVRPGDHGVRVRFIGYRALELPVRVGRGGRGGLRVTLSRSPQLLGTVRVTDQHGCAATSVDGFECRRSAGVGMYRDAAEIRSLRPVHWADMFDGMPGLRRSMTMGPHGHDWRVAAPPSQCIVELWNGQPPMKIDPEAPFRPDDFWKPDDVVAIEFYDRHEKVPAPYQALAWPPLGQRCGLIIYWLRGAAREAKPATPEQI